MGTHNGLRNRIRRITRVAATVALVFAATLTVGCREKEPVYGVEQTRELLAPRREVWAVAPALNLSGQAEVDPLLQADIAFQQLQHVRGLTVVPVNRVAEVYASLRIEQVQSAEQAAVVCELLGCDALVVPTVTAYDPYNPPKFGASLQMFRRSSSAALQAAVDPRELSRAAAPPADAPLPGPADDAGFVQSVGMFDAANGTVREALAQYARGRNDPVGPLGAKEYLVSMERYCGFVYHELIGELLVAARPRKG
jgi:hypothetical protein